MVRVLESKRQEKALSMSADCNTRLCYINPELGAAATVMESGRNVAMTGAVPKAITDCLNFEILQILKLCGNLSHLVKVSNKLVKS